MICWFRKLLCTVVGVLSVCFSLSAQESISSSPEKDKKNQVLSQDNKELYTKNQIWQTPFAYVGGHCGYGRTYSSGDLSGGVTGSVPDSGYSAGLNFGYGFSDYAVIDSGIDYVHKKMSVNRSYSGQKARYTISANYLDILLGYKGSYRFVYAGTGLYFGKTWLGWSESVSYNGTETSTSLSGSKRSYCKNTAGVYLLFGGKYEITKGVFAECGLRYKYPLMDEYKNDGSLKSEFLQGEIGISYRVETKK